MMAQFPMAQFSRLVIILLTNCPYWQDGHRHCEHMTAEERAACPQHQIIASEAALLRLLWGAGRAEILRAQECNLYLADKEQAVRVAETRLTEARVRPMPRPDYSG